MDVEQLKAKAGELKTQLLNQLGTLQQVFNKARQDYKQADGFEAFFKTFIKEEVMDQPERIPVVVYSLWLLILLSHWKFWIFFAFGILPVVLYYLVGMFKKVPSSEY
jgi:hypothetical protein